jgi:phenylalanyl-tRNA synthetase beta chain
MYISYHWLKDFVKIPAKIKPPTIAEELTSHTVEVEGLVNQADRFNKVVVGRVLTVNPHPNADRLRLTVVDVKTKKLSIVCGAPNVAVGQLVPVALVGAKLPNGSEIQESVIRGEKSSGMLCAEDELGLGRNHEGIMILSANAKVGENFSKYLSADDVILEIDNKSLSNRPDLLNHYGLARELAAIFDLPLKAYDKFLSPPEELMGGPADKFSVKVEAPELCPRYLALKVENIEVKESPDWLKARLVAIGQRPINNIVDLTNYVMFDCGQPLHAFDAAEFKKIVVRRATLGETLETLDEKERVLNNEDLIITDGDKPLAIAGVMGGNLSGVTAGTTALILESANFSASTVRKTSQKLGLRTEASLRFEKSLDPNLTLIAVRRFVKLLREICPKMVIAGDLLDVNNTKISPVKIDFNLAWLANKIGQDIPREVAISSLKKLGFKVEAAAKSAGDLKVTVPSWRATKDITSREDLAEEVLRLYGYDKIASQLPVVAMTLPEVNEERKLERGIKNILALKNALSETYNYSFVGADQLKKLNIDFSNYLKLVNPLAETQAWLRQSLVPGLVGNIKNNQFKRVDLGFFEIGSVFFKAPGNLRKDLSDDQFLPYQEKRLGLALAGSDDIFGRLKGIISSLFKNLINYEIAVEYGVFEGNLPWSDQRVVAKITISGQEIGWVALLDAAVSENFNLKKAVALAEINFSQLVSWLPGLASWHFQEGPKYPPLTRDLAFVVSEEIMYNDLRQAIHTFNPLIRSVELFDVYIGNKLNSDQKSLAFHVIFQSEEKTLTTLEVDKIQRELIDYLVQKFGAQLRDF